MINFKQYLLEQLSDTENEADILLHQIMSNLDEGDIDYTDTRLDFNVGVLVKRSGYAKLYFSVFNQGRANYSVKLGKNKSKDGFTMVISTSKYPSRLKIDNFFNNKAIYNKVKTELVKYIEDYKDEDSEYRSTYESDTELNTPENFNKLMDEMKQNIQLRVDDYNGAMKEINAKLENTANEHEKQILVRSIEQLKSEYFGENYKIFKRKAVDECDLDLTRLEKKYKHDLDRKLEDIYEKIVYNL